MERPGRVALFINIHWLIVLFGSLSQKNCTLMWNQKQGIEMDEVSSPG